MRNWRKSSGCLGCYLHPCSKMELGLLRSCTSGTSNLTLKWRHDAMTSVNVMHEYSTGNSCIHSSCWPYRFDTHSKGPHDAPTEPQHSWWRGFEIASCPLKVNRTSLPPPFISFELFIDGLIYSEDVTTLAWGHSDNNPTSKVDCMSSLLL